MGFERVKWRVVAVAAIVALLFLFAALAASSAMASDGWMRYASGQSLMDANPMMVADPSGKLHIVYTGMDDEGHYGQAYISEGDGRDWTSTAIPLGLTDPQPSAAFDSSGAIHLTNTYDDPVGNDRVCYVTDAGDAWNAYSYEVGGTALCSRIAVDADGTPRILAVNMSYDYTTAVLSLCPTEEGWNESVACTLGVEWSFDSMSSLMKDPEGRLHALLVKNLRYSYEQAVDRLVLDDGVWSLEEGPDLGEGPVLFSSQSGAIDEAGNTHLAFTQSVEDGGILRYAVEQDGAWTVETLRDLGSPYYMSTITIDDSGIPYVAYTYYSTEEDKGTEYAVRSSGTWETTVVDERTPPSLPSMCSIVVDASGGIHLCTVYANDESRCDITYMTDTESGLLMKDWLAHATLLTGLVAAAVCIPLASVWFASERRRRRAQELEKVGLQD